jgi:glutamine cyclotransferase
MRYILPYVFGALMLFSCANSNAGKASSEAKTVSSPPRIQEYRLEVVAEYPHDVTSYTQGLFFHQGELYETTGQYGRSTLRKVDLMTGEAIELKEIDDKYFVEGSVVLGDDLYVLTWQEKEVFIYDSATLEFKASKRYPREGWGLTTDGKELIASDGSAFLYFMDKDLNVNRRLQVKAGYRAVQWLNELEYIGGKIWANVYTSDEIAIINPSSGYVEAVIDCKGLLPEELYTSDTDVLNGIAYNPQTGRLYLTGKNWPKLYEVKVVEKK